MVKIIISLIYIYIYTHTHTSLSYNLIYISYYKCAIHDLNLISIKCHDISVSHTLKILKIVYDDGNLRV